MEPERHIEKLLRAYAKKRRDQAGAAPELHPATRRLLQGEVARRAANRGEDSFLLTIMAVLRRRLVFAVCVVAMALVGAALVLPALSNAKSKSQTFSAMSNLKQIGMAVQTFADDNRRFPSTLAEVKSALPDKVLIDPRNGQPFIYVAGAKSPSNMEPASVLAYSPADKKGRMVLYADGHVAKVSREQFEELSTREVALIATAGDRARRELADRAPERRFSRSAPTASAEAPAPAKAAAPASLGVEEAKMKLADSEAGGLSKRELATRTVDIARKDESIPEAQPAPATSSGSAVAADSLKSAPALPLEKAAAQTLAVQYYFSNAQRYVQVQPPSVPPPASRSLATPLPKAPAVLAAFQMEQNGGEIRVVDQDGSVYNGTVELTNAAFAPAPAAGQNLSFAKEAQVPDAAGASVQNYYFRVSGTNRSLQQNVMFTGNLAAAADGALLNWQSNAAPGIGGQYQARPANQLQLPLGNSRITGTAVIDNRREIQVIAVPATP